MLETVGWLGKLISNANIILLTIEPGDGDTLEEDEEEQAHAASRVVVKQFEHIEATLVTTESCAFLFCLFVTEGLGIIMTIIIDLLKWTVLRCHHSSCS